MKAVSVPSMLLTLLFCGLTLSAPANAGMQECVILLHGLARTDASMTKLESALVEKGYDVVNVAYPSRKMSIEHLAIGYVGAAVDSCREHPVETIHFVSHSMGGILIRYYLAHRQLAELGRVVMLSPPNQGSEVVDELRNVPGFYLLHGPAGQQLGTGTESMPNKLGPVQYPVGVITGNKSINPFLSLLIPGSDDGKVSIERAKLEGMTDFLVVPHSHPMIMKNDEVIRHTLCFLRNGYFNCSVNS